MCDNNSRRAFTILWTRTPSPSYVPSRKLNDGGTIVSRSVSTNNESDDIRDDTGRRAFAIDEGKGSLICAICTMRLAEKAVRKQHVLRHITSST